MEENKGAADRFRGAHLSHCYQGEHQHGCAYGDENCPAPPPVEGDPGDRAQDPETRSLALVRYLATSRDEDMLQKARKWAVQIAHDMENEDGTV